MVYNIKKPYYFAYYVLIIDQYYEYKQDNAILLGFNIATEQQILNALYFLKMKEENKKT